MNGRPAATIGVMTTARVVNGTVVEIAGHLRDVALDSMIAARTNRATRKRHRPKESA